MQTLSERKPLERRVEQKPESSQNVRGPAASTDPLADPVNLLRWYLSYDTALRESLKAKVASLGSRDDRVAAIESWMRSEGLVDGISGQLVFTFEQLVAATKPNDVDPIKLSDVELDDAREFLFDTVITQPYRAALQAAVNDMAALDPAAYANGDEYLAAQTARFQAFVDATKRPALIDQLGNHVPASTVSLSTLARALTGENAPVENWWGTYNYVVATYQNAERTITAPAAPIAQPASPGAVYVTQTDLSVALDVLVYGVDSDGAAIAERVTSPNNTKATFKQVLGVHVIGDDNGDVPDGVGVTISSGGTILATLPLSALDSTTRDAGNGGFQWVVVDNGVTLHGATKPGTAVLVGRGPTDAAQTEAVSFEVGKRVAPKKTWLEIEAVYLGAFAGTLNLSAPHSLNGQQRVLDTRSGAKVEDAPQLVIGSPDYTMALGTTMILNPKYDPGTAPAQLSFDRAPGQSFSGVFKLLFTTSPRGSENLQGYYAVGRVTFPAQGAFRDAFALYGDVTLDCMQSGAPPAAQHNPLVDTSVATIVFGTVGVIFTSITFAIAARYAFVKWQRSNARKADWRTDEQRVEHWKANTDYLKKCAEEMEAESDLEMDDLDELARTVTHAKTDLENAQRDWPKVSERRYPKMSAQDLRRTATEIQRLEARVQALEKAKREAAKEEKLNPEDEEL